MAVDNKKRDSCSVTMKERFVRTTYAAVAEDRFGMCIAINIEGEEAMVKIAVDAMGGDNAPGEIVAGAVMAAQSREDIQIFLIGKEEVVSEELKKHTYKKEQIEVVNATEVIETE